MRVTQHDIAQLDDVTVQRLVVAAKAPGEHGRLSPFWSLLGDALIRALRERRRLVAVAELEMVDDDEQEGALLEDAPDVLAAVVEACEECRRAESDEPGER